MSPVAKSKRVRQLADLLTKAGQAEVDHRGLKATRAQVLAEYIWEAATEGKVVFPDSHVLKLSARDWRDVSSWIHTHIDGPTARELDLSGSLEGGLGEATTEDLRAMVAKAGVQLGHLDSTVALQEAVDHKSPEAPTNPN